MVSSLYSYSIELFSFLAFSFNLGRKWVLGCSLWLLPWCGLKLPLDGGDEDASSRSRWERNTYVEDRNNDLTFDEFNMQATLKEVHYDIRDVLEYGRVHWHFGDSIMVRNLHKTGNESVNDVAQWVLLLHGSAWPSLPSTKGRWKTFQVSANDIANYLGVPTDGVTTYFDNVIQETIWGTHSREWPWSKSVVCMCRCMLSIPYPSKRPHTISISLVANPCQKYHPLGRTLQSHR